MRLFLALTLLLTTPSLAVECPKGSTLTGTYVPIDGDSGHLNGTGIRLQGLAAPEWDAPGGPAATGAMRALVLGAEVTCTLDGSSTYDRCAAICTVDGRDIALELVREGRARDCPRYSGGRYAEAEQAAVDEGSAIREVYRLPGYCGAR